MTKTILVLAANPKDTSRLSLDEEVRKIRDSLARAQHGEFIFDSSLAASPEDIHRAMLINNPSFVHFCGHGYGTDGIVFVENREIKLVSTEALSGLFKLFAETVECVVLNACYTDIQAQAIAQHINYVVGMKEDIGDAAAIVFAGAFYDALGVGRSIKFAYELACNAIQMAGIPENLTPILRTKNTPSSSLCLNQGVSTEGVIVRVALDIFDHQLPQVVQRVKGIVGVSYELIGCRNGGISLFLPRHEQQPWFTILSLSLQKAFHIALELKQAAIAIHVEHDGCCLGQGLILGREINFADMSLPVPLRPYIFLSGEVYQFLSQYLDSGNIENLLPRALQQKGIHSEIIKLTTVLQRTNAGFVEDEIREVYNLCLKSASGELIIGDMNIPPDRFKINHCRSENQQTFIERLVNADRVCIVGITNENLGQHLKQSLQKRMELGREFWDELHVIFLARELLSSVFDYRCTKFDLLQAIEDRYLAWGRGLREVREFLLSCGSNVSNKWECLQFNYMLPFGAQRYIDKVGNSLIQLIPILPNSDIQEGYFIDTSKGFFCSRNFQMP